MSFDRGSKDIIGKLSSKYFSSSLFLYDWLRICRDYIFLDRKLQIYIAQDILQLLDFDNLLNAEQVSKAWRSTINEGKLWEKLYKRNVKNVTPNANIEIIEKYFYRF